LTTLSEKETEAAARKFMLAWVPVLWGTASRAEQQPPAAKQPQARVPQAQQPRRPAPRRFVCPPGYICQR